jgi:hypothetical protein
VGLAFEPPQGRNAVVDLRGTLWLTWDSPSLTSLEYQYVGHDGTVERVRANGTLHFHVMPNGAVFADEWRIRSQLFDQPPISAAPQTNATIVRETGGVVLAAGWADGTKWDNQVKPFKGVVTEAGSTTALSHVLIALPATRDTVFTDAAGRFTLSPLMPGQYILEVSDTSFSSYLAPRTGGGEFAIARGERTELHVEISGPAEASRTQCDAPVGAGAAILLGRIVNTGSAHVPVDVQVTARWEDKTSSQEELQTMSLDDAARFSVCGAPIGRPAHIAMIRSGLQFADTTIIIASGIAVPTLEWKLDVQARMDAAGRSLATLRGHTTIAGSTTPVSDAEVWIPVLDRRTTSDSAGSFHFDSLPPGQHVVQARKFGTAVQRDLIVVSADQVTTHDFALVRQAVQLDTVKTVAAGIRGFEQRRAHGAGGFFLADSTLREHESEGLASLLVGKVAGLKTQFGGGSGFNFLVDGRKTCANTQTLKGPCRPCFVTIYTDGALTFTMASGVDVPQDPPNADALLVNQFAAVEYYAYGSQAPPQFNRTDSGCGVLLLWSRER